MTGTKIKQDIKLLRNLNVLTEGEMKFVNNNLNSREGVES